MRPPIEMKTMLLMMLMTTPKTWMMVELMSLPLLPLVLLVIGDYVWPPLMPPPEAILS